MDKTEFRTGLRSIFKGPVADLMVQKLLTKVLQDTQRARPLPVAPTGPDNTDLRGWPCPCQANGSF